MRIALRITALLPLFAAVALAPVPASAKVQIKVDLDTQRLTAVRDSGETVVWKISSGRSGYETPAGHYSVYRMEPDHHSDEYDQAPMPYAMFFSPRGLAIHGTSERGLGRPASHGCVRLSVDNARQLYDWVEKDGGGVVDIVGDAKIASRRGGRAEAERAAEPAETTRQPRVAPPAEEPDATDWLFESVSR